jgi:hypothetical protein
MNDTYIDIHGILYNLNFETLHELNGRQQNTDLIHHMQNGTNAHNYIKTQHKVFRVSM